MASHKSRVMIVHSNENYAYESTAFGYLNEYEHARCTDWKERQI